MQTQKKQKDRGHGLQTHSNPLELTTQLTPHPTTALEQYHFSRRHCPSIASFLLRDTSETRNFTALSSRLSSKNIQLHHSSSNKSDSSNVHITVKSCVYQPNHQTGNREQTCAIKRSPDPNPIVPLLNTESGSKRIASELTGHHRIRFRQTIERAFDLAREGEGRNPPGEGRGGGGRAPDRRVDAALVPAGRRGAETRGREVRVRLLVERGPRRRRRRRRLLLLLLAGGEDDLTEQCGPFHGADPSSGAQIPDGSR
jgi:hypothetical protein